jgi:branched-chain amino acid transport system permease protein
MKLLARSPRLGLIGLGILMVALGVALPREDWLGQGAVALSLSIAATGLGVALGLAGEYLLGISFVVAAAAYPTAVLTSVFGWSFWPAALVGVVTGAVVGLVVSLPGLRISQFYFGMLGFFMVYLIPSVVEMLAVWTNGSKGLAVYAKPEIFGIRLDEHGMFILAAVALTLTLLVVLNVRQSPWAIGMRRMRDAPHSLLVEGTHVWRIRFATYLFVSVLAGVSGAIYSHINVFLQPAQFGFTMTTLILAAVIVGGSRSLLGPSIGLVILYLGPRLFANIEGIADIVYGVIVLVSVLLFRGGVVQATRDLWTWMRGSRGRRTPAGESTAAPVPTDSAALVETLAAFRTSGGATGGALVVSGVRKRFGVVRALDFEPDDRIEIEPGTVTLLLGPNGSGKTTLLNAVSGLVPADAGSVTIGDRDVTRAGAVAIARAGVSRSFQTPVLPDEVSPVDLFSTAILRLAPIATIHWILWTPTARRLRAAARETAGRIATSSGLGAAADQPCAALTSGQRRLVDVMTALISRSTLVLLDEPAAGLSDTERTLLASTVRGLADTGIGFVVVEHDLELALALADHVVVMAEGRPIADGTPDDIQQSALVRSVLLGAAR